MSLITLEQLALETFFFCNAFFPQNFPNQVFPYKVIGPFYQQVVGILISLAPFPLLQTKLIDGEEWIWCKGYTSSDIFLPYC